MFATALTLFDKLWQRHLVDVADDGEGLIYVDRHLVYEVTSPQAFAGLLQGGRRPWRPEIVLVTADHNVPTTNAERAGVRHIADPLSWMQVRQLTANCRKFGTTEFDLGDPRQGIIREVGPEQGATLPGMTVVGGDSHTSTHGAFGALAFGVGTSEVEHVFATQCLVPRPMRSCCRWTARSARASVQRTRFCSSSARSAPPAPPATPTNSPIASAPSSRTDVLPNPGFSPEPT